MLQILHLEDGQLDAFLINRALADDGIEAKIVVAKSGPEFVSALKERQFDLILADSGMPGFSGLEALKLVRQKSPETAVICVSGAVTEELASACLDAGATDYVLKDHLWQLVAAVRCEQERLRLLRRNRGMARLVTAGQELSLARDLNAIMAVVRRAARELTGADGATFVLREGDLCHYADEDAIAPLWKGQRFPLQSCISGWAMLHRQPAVIEDIYADPRIPADAYRPTFVKSLAIVPIRTEAPVGAMGIYWAKQHQPTAEEVELLQALANTTAVAMENVRVHNELEQRVKDRTAQLEAANRELEAFSYAVSHDLGAPLRTVRGFSEAALKQCGDKLDENGKDCLERVRAAGEHMTNLISDLLGLSKFSKGALRRSEVNLSELARGIISRLSAETPERRLDVTIADGIKVEGDSGLLRAALENLLSNAWKYTSKCPHPRVEFCSMSQADGPPAYYVRDNGVGFEMKYAQKLFQPFQRLHSANEYPGSGIGLATVQRIIQRHGGRVWAEAAVGRGATFYFTLNGQGSPSV
jgi:hypothetical protein